MKNEELTAAVQEAAARILADRQWPVTIQLQHPIEFGKGETITELVFRRGKMGDLKGLKAGEEPSFDQLLLVGSRMCGKPVAALEQLSDGDSGEVVELVLGFFARSQVAGRKLSAQ